MKRLVAFLVVWVPLVVFSSLAWIAILLDKPVTAGSLAGLSVVQAMLACAWWCAFVHGRRVR